MTESDLCEITPLLSHVQMASSRHLNALAGVRFSRCPGQIWFLKFEFSSLFPLALKILLILNK
jgi:hypothetical protein